MHALIAVTALATSLIAFALAEHTGHAHDLTGPVPWVIGGALALAVAVAIRGVLKTD